MTYSELDKNWQQEIHHKIVNHDATAFAELCEAVLPLLVTFLRTLYPAADSHLHEITAIDCLLSYQAKPAQFNTERLTLIAYLKMAARGDMLNALQRTGRRQRRLVNIEETNPQSLLDDADNVDEMFAFDDWLAEHTTQSQAEVITALDQELTAVDREVLLLMLDGVRDSREYAVAMGISHLDTGRQRLAVKRAKDRLNKKLERFGQRMENS